METEIAEKTQTLIDKGLIKVLLVEDDATDALLIERVFTKCPQPIEFDTDRAKSLSAAVNCLDNSKYDVVLLDLMLPDSEGLETVQRIEKANSHIPIVVLTGLDDEKIGLSAIKIGAMDYLVKGQVLDNVLVRAIQYAIERKWAENALRKANERFEEYDRLRSEFIATVSHELRTPLTIFKNVISNILSEIYGRINNKVRENLKIADDSVDRLGRTVKDIFDISEIEAERLHLSFEQTNLQSVVSEVIESLKSMAETKNIEIKNNILDCELFVNVDRNRIVQVLTNLIDNAIKFAPDVGGCINVRLKDLNDEVEVDVEDNGYGIEKNDIDKIFSRFVQVKKMSGPGEHGTGLGLAICQNLVEMHGGRIWVESQPGQRTNFCFTIPKSRVEKIDS